MNTNDVKQLLRDACAAAGSESSFAHGIGCTPSLVNAVLHGTRQPRGRILAALNLEIAPTTYRPKKPDAEFSILKTPTQSNAEH